MIKILKIGDSGYYYVIKKPFYTFDGAEIIAKISNVFGVDELIEEIENLEDRVKDLEDKLQ